MNKIFIACPFIKYINEAGFSNSEFRKFTENVYDLCSNYASDVFLALKREEYGAKQLKKYSCKLDFDEAKNADLVVAFPDDSMGVAVELGWVSAMGKPVILLLNKKQIYTPLVYNIHKITSGKVIFFENDEDKTLKALKEVLDYYKMMMHGGGE